MQRMKIYSEEFVFDMMDRVIQRKHPMDAASVLARLQRAGIVTAKGNLRKPYRNLCSFNVGK